MAVPLRLATYNALAQAYCRKNFFPYALVRVLEWSYRLPNIANEVANLQADVLCMQVYFQALPVSHVQGGG